MKYLLLVLPVLLFAACGTTTSVDESSDGNIDPYADPPGYSGDPFAGFGPVTSIGFPADGNPELETVLVTSPEEGSWTVQVAACSSMDAALTMRDTVAAQTGQPVFIDTIGSYFKVRVGSFETASDSDALRVQLRSNGYPDAWSVER